MTITLGFITSALAGRSLNEIAAWGQAEGYAHMEVGPHAALDELRAYLSSPTLRISALLYCRNIRHLDPEKRKEFLENTEARIDIARDHGVPIVNISTGVNPKLGLRENVVGSAEALQRLCDRAGEGVMVAVENCPDTGNIAINPELWGALIESVDRPNFRLTYDPSHLVRLGIEPYEPLYEFGPHIIHVHAKDTEVIRAKLRRQGFLGEGWWRYRVPGWGEVDWRAVLTRLIEVGFSGGISLEHEDPLFGGSHHSQSGTVASSADGEAGLRAGRAHLEPLLSAL